MKGIADYICWVVVAKGVPDAYAKVLGLLRKEKTLPKRRKGLEGKIKGWFQKASDDERSALLKRLLDDGFVRDDKGVLSYSLDKK